jgi:outer membrane protein TolC
MRLHSLALLVCSLSFGLAPSATLSATPLSLIEAQDIAAGDAPVVAAQSAALRAAQEMRIGAGQLPDPKLIAGVENLPVDSADRFNLTRDFMTMRKIGFMQDFVRDEKRKLQSERADAEIRKEAANLSLAEVTLKRDVALAWIERYFAERQLDLLSEMNNELELQNTVAQATLAGAKGQASEPLSAHLAAAQLGDRITDAERMVARSKANLARWVGAAAQRPLGTPPAFDELALHHATLLAELDAHPHLGMFPALEAIAQSEARLADAAKHPDWSFEVVYAQRGPAFSNMLSVGVRIDLPIFQARRQDPLLAAKLALVEQTRAQTEDARRAHLAEVQGMLADWESSQTRLARYRNSVLPLAHEATETTLAGYRGGRNDLSMVINARKAEIDVRIAHLQAQLEQARTWANLNYLAASDRKEKP